MAMNVACLLALLCVVVSKSQADDSTITIDDAPGMGRMFDGIGGLSGGGATSKLLVNYPEQERNQILDYLFKPNFGASLQILKVEIGGDAQSTDGTEASHMHNSWEENYQRGYEWWLMKEAKKRNGKIKLYALPWGFPGWIGKGQNSPYTDIQLTANYVVNWINGAKQQHGLTIDYVGIWNERNWNADYVVALRSTLDNRGFNQTKIIVGDGDWDPASYIMKHEDFAKYVDGVGCHYPGTLSSSDAKSCGKPLWSSEDYSSMNDEVGGGCWARILNQNYVNGLMTSTISWNLIASYYQNLPFFRDGLMTAVEPWSGNYSVDTPIWVSAHTTQFTDIGWYYFQHGHGVGKLPKGGSIVTLASPNFTPFGGNDMTVVIETMTHDHSTCIRPSLPPYTVEPQVITIQLQGIALYAIKQLNVWYSKIGFNGAKDVMFQKKDPLKFSPDGKAQLSLGLDEIWTLTTKKTGAKGAYPSSSPSKPFPLPYTDNMEGYDLYQEPFDLAQQMGSWEVLSANNNKFARQMMLERPVAWCQAESANKTLNIIGSAAWTDIFIETDVSLPAVNGSTGVFVAARVDAGGCHANGAKGIYFFALPDKYIVSNDLGRQTVLKQGDLSYKTGEWHKLSLLVQGSTVTGAFDGKTVFSINTPSTPANGWAAIGTDSFALADFDNLKLDTKQNGQSIMNRYSQTHTLYFESEKH